MVLSVRKSIQTGSLGLTIEASRSVFDVAFPLYAVQVLHSRSTLFFSAMHIGAGLGMVAFAQKNIALRVESLLSLPYFILGTCYYLLGISTPSFRFFLLIAGFIGLATSVAGVSSSVQIQILSQNKAERSYLNAVYRVMGIIARIVSPLIIAKVLESGAGAEILEEDMVESRHTTLFSTLGVSLCFLAAAFFLLTSGSPQHGGSSEQYQSGSQKQLPAADAQEWSQICMYCACVSLPNMAGGLLRSLLAPFLMHKLAASPNFFSTTHSIAQCTSVFFIIVSSRLLQHGGRSSLLRSLATQSFVMAIAAFALGSCTSSLTAAATFVLLRSLEESCKLPNSLMLHELCTRADKPSTPIQSTNRALLVRAIALQKAMGAVLKVCVSLLSAATLTYLGVAATIYIAAGICMSGSASLAWIHYQHQKHHAKLT